MPSISQNRRIINKPRKFLDYKIYSASEFSNSIATQVINSEEASDNMPPKLKNEDEPDLADLAWKSAALDVLPRGCTKMSEWGPTSRAPDNADCSVSAWARVFGVHNNEIPRALQGYHARSLLEAGFLRRILAMSKERWEGPIRLNAVPPRDARRFLDAFSQDTVPHRLLFQQNDELLFGTPFKIR